MRSSLYSILLYSDSNELFLPLFPPPYGFCLPFCSWRLRFLIPGHLIYSFTFWILLIYYQISFKVFPIIINYYIEIINFSLASAFIPIPSLWKRALSEPSSNWFLFGFPWCVFTCCWNWELGCWFWVLLSKLSMITLRFFSKKSALKKFARSKNISHSEVSFFDTQYFNIVLRSI